MPARVVEPVTRHGAPAYLRSDNGPEFVAVAVQAIRRGHQPVLAGRSAASLAALGKRLGLPWKALGLDEPDQLQRAVSEVDAVLNAAGPFITTAPPLVAACLAAGTDYLDIAGEIPALQHLFARDQAARERKIALIGGAGFGAVCRRLFLWRDDRRIDCCPLALLKSRRVAQPHVTQ